MALCHCHDFEDFRRLARWRLPGPIFDYIDGGADDEATLRRNTASFEACDLVPNVLRGVETVDLSVTVMGRKLAMPVYCSPPPCSGCSTTTASGRRQGGRRIRPYACLTRSGLTRSGLMSPASGCVDR